MIVTIIVVLLILALLGGVSPGWHGFGYYPSGILGVIVVVLLILLLMGRI